jgi:phage terminase large subunit-like protein
MKAARVGWNFAVPDWETRLREGLSLLPSELPLDADEAARAIGIYNELRLPDVGGKPKLIDAGGEWFREVLGAAHGSVDDTGLRHIREILVLVPKKNSKTTNAGAAAITAMLTETEPSQAYYIWGPTQEISDRAFAQASGMIEADDEVLKKRFHIAKHLKAITDRKWETTLKVSTFDEKVATGAIPKWALIEELHILGKIAYAARVLGQVRGGMQTRPGALLWMITTQSDQPPTGVFKTELDFARAIRDGRIAGQAATLLPILYEFPESVQRDEGQSWEDPAMWPQVLPNLGKSLRIDMLEADYAAAKEKGEAERRRWASQHLNIQIGLALHSDRWVGADYWEAAGVEWLTLEELLARSEVITAGIDGGGLDDLLGLFLIGREKGTGRWLGWGHAWANESIWKLRPVIAAQLDDLVDAVEVTRCAKPNDDVEGVADILERVLDAGLFPESAAVGIDQIGAATLPDVLAQRGFTMGELDSQLVSVAQGFKMNGLILGLERKLWDGTFVHGGQQLMAWAVSNARTEMRGNAVLITKQVSGRSKIDPVIAMLNAFAMMVRGPEAVGNAAPEIMVL